MRIPEENGSMDCVTTDPDKMSKVWSTADIENYFVYVLRFGKSSDDVEQRDTRRWPVLASLQTRDIRNKTLERKKATLKLMGVTYRTISIKKDINSSVR